MKDAIAILTQHCFCEDSEKSNHFHKPVDGQHDVSDSRSYRPHDQHEAAILTN
jgi:hypothetical protein